MDKPRLVRALEATLGEPIADAAIDRFVRYAAELDRFGRKLNLTAIREEADVIDKHFADSLAVARRITGGTLLDVGTGAGFPGVPVAIVRPEVTVTAIDAARKKVGFLKALVATLDLPNVRPVHLHLDRTPLLGTFDAAVARALDSVGEWVERAQPHVRSGGRILAMVGRRPDGHMLEDIAVACGLRLAEVVPYQLPISCSRRALIEFERP